MNRVSLIGNLTRDPELRATGGGTAVLQMRLAFNERAKNPRTDEWEDRPNFVDVVMFGTRAESVSRFLERGSRIGVDGRLRWSEWEDKQTGDKRSKIEVIVDEIDLLSSRDESSGSRDRDRGRGRDDRDRGRSSARLRPRVA